MTKIQFKNSARLANIGARLYNGDTYAQAAVNDEGNDCFSVDFDSKSYDSLRFYSADGEETVRLFPADSRLGVEHKYNTELKRNASYLTLEGLKISGKVDNYVLTDVNNLAHRADKAKKISVFVPESYDGSTSYDLLYFFDAQNLFCSAGHYTECGDPYGSWQLDLVLCELHRRRGDNIIVVGIDNADEYRSNELFMSPEKFGKLSPLATAIPEDDFSRGYLDGLSEFMRGTLHDFIKSKYNIKEDNIGIGGSSMGGIAAFYCGLRERGFYRYVLSYSPAFGLYEMSAFEDYFAAYGFEAEADRLPKIHVYCGGGDPLERLLLPAAQAMKATMVKHGYPEHLITETYDMEKPHNEESWRFILPKSFE